MCRLALLDPGRQAPQNWQTVVEEFPKDVAMEALVEVERLVRQEHTCCFCNKVKASAVCLDCHDVFCDTCKVGHTQQRVTRHHKVQDFTALTADQLASNRPPSCPNHPDKDCELFCSTHNQAICTLCSVSHHRGCPDVKELQHKSEECQASLTQRVAGLVTDIQQLDAACTRLEQQQQDTQKKARDFLAEMRQVRDDVMSRATAWYLRIEDTVNNAVADVTLSAQRGKELLVQRKGRATSSRRTIERVHSSKNDGAIISMST
jgi:hypothetical protein